MHTCVQSSAQRCGRFVAQALQAQQPASLAGRHLGGRDLGHHLLPATWIRTHPRRQRSPTTRAVLDDLEAATRNLGGTRAPRLEADDATAALTQISDDRSGTWMYPPPGSESRVRELLVLAVFHIRRDLFEPPLDRLRTEFIHFFRFEGLQMAVHV